MNEKFYDQIGRAYLDIVALHNEAQANKIYLGGGFDQYGDFTLRLYDAAISESYYDTPMIAVKPENMDIIFATIGEVRGFIKGFAKATLIERKRAEEAAKPEIDFVTGEPLNEQEAA